MVRHFEVSDILVQFSEFPEAFRLQFCVLLERRARCVQLSTNLFVGLFERTDFCVVIRYWFIKPFQYITGFADYRLSVRFLRFFVLYGRCDAVSFRGGTLDLVYFLLQLRLDILDIVRQLSVAIVQ